MEETETITGEAKPRAKHKAKLEGIRFGDRLITP